MNGTLAWIAVYAAVIAAGVGAIVVGMHLTRRRLDPTRTPDEFHTFDRPVPSHARVHVLEPGCWCRPDIQYRDGGTWIVHHTPKEPTNA